MYNETLLLPKSIFNLKNKVIRQPELPHPFIPASNDYFLEQFYWDSFFIMQGLDLNLKDEFEIAKGMVENLFTLFDKYGYIPNSSRRNLSRTQPPFLTSMIFMIYEKENDLGWLRKGISIAKEEYAKVWLANPRITPTGLSRYYDPLHVEGENTNAEDESGWDFTPRFLERCSRINPVDLNCLLYLYEKHFEKFSRIINDIEEEVKWQEKAENRKKLIEKYFWNKKEGCYADYDFEKQEQLPTRTLAMFFPLYCGACNKVKAEKIIRKLKEFEHKHGLVTCKQDYGTKNKQWNYPNGWAPLQFIVIEGLKRHGYLKDAKRIARKWVELCAQNYLHTKHWEEKYCVIENDRCAYEGIGRADDLRYNHQNELYWTQGVFIYLHRWLEKIN